MAPLTDGFFPTAVPELIYAVPDTRTFSILKQHMFDVTLLPHQKKLSGDGIWNAFERGDSRDY
jgi:hypothetical protein